VATLPDFLERRYSRACRDWLAVLSILSAIFIHIGFSLYTGAVVLKGLFGIDINLSIFVTAALTGVYTIIGGLLAVVMTDSVQTILLIGGSACVLVAGLVSVGGWSGLAAAVEPVKLTILRTASETPSLPWYSVFLPPRRSRPCRSDRRSGSLSFFSIGSRSGPGGTFPR